MSTGYLRNFLLLFLFTIGGMATLSAQNLGNEGGYTLPEVEVCGCDICDEQIDCDDRDFHEWMHQKEKEEEEDKNKDLEDLRGSGSSDWGNIGSGNLEDEIIEIPEITIVPDPSDFGSEGSDDFPCFEYFNNTLVSMPLVDMELQPANKNNLDGALFGETRRNSDGSPKEHKGIDFASPVGTDIFSIYDGVVTKVVTGQVNRVWSEEKNKYVYPDDYRGDSNDAGNRIYIKSTINGEDIYMGYWHLDADNPIDDDIRVGDSIFAGQLIGKVGQTGNAMGGSSHLHLAAYKYVDGEMVYVDPQSYLGIEFEKDDNGKLKSTNIKTPCD